MYLYSLNPIATMTPTQFAENVEVRLYVEWCLNHENAGERYDGQSFNQWISDETLYEMERRKQMDAQGHISAREKTLSAAVQRAIDKFRTWGGIHSNDRGEGNVLRGSLERY